MERLPKSDLTTVVGAISKIAHAYVQMDEDPMNDYVGFHPVCDPGPEMDKVARAHGWDGCTEVRESARARTSDRYVHFNMGWL